MHDARSVANLFIELAEGAGSPLTPMQVQKLVYLAHAWMLALYDRPLINEPFEAWKYGPVLPMLYHCLSHYRGDPITGYSLPLHSEDERAFDDAEKSIITQVFQKYGHLSGPRLSALTHQPGSPWHQADGRRDRYISNDVIKKYYVKLVKQAQRGYT